MDLAIIGGGPVGLEAAARAARAGLAAVLFEAGEVADHVRAWGWLRLFSPFGWNAGPAGLEVLRGQGGELPAAEALLTGAELRTHYLLPLRAVLHEQLQAQGRLEEAREYIADVTRFELKPQEFDPDGFWTLARPNSLKRAQIGILRELYILRDELAQAYDHPPQRLIANKALMQIVNLQPRSIKQLYDIRGLPAWLLRQSGDEIIQALRHGASSRLRIARPKQEPIPQTIVDRYSALHNWRRDTADARGVESDVIISRRALWDIARRNPTKESDLGDIRGLGPWRRRTYGADLIAVVALCR